MIIAAAQERENYLNASHGLKSWLLTKDHKRIGLLYLATITLFFFIGGSFATLIRVELLTPQGDLVSSEPYNKLIPAAKLRAVSARAGPRQGVPSIRPERQALSGLSLRHRCQRARSRPPAAGQGHPRTSRAAHPLFESLLSPVSGPAGQAVGRDERIAALLLLQLGDRSDGGRPQNGALAWPRHRPRKIPGDRAGERVPWAQLRRAVDHRTTQVPRGF